MKKPESTLSYDRCVPVFCCFVAAFYFADALIMLTPFILLTPFIPPLPSFHSCLPDSFSSLHLRLKHKGCQITEYQCAAYSRGTGR